jgi:hypothetical protein
VFCQESLKALTSWEVGMIGLNIARALFPVGALQLAAGFIGMGLFSTITKRLLD